MIGNIPFCRYRKLLLILFALGFVVFSFGQNAIVTENALPGNPSSEWDISGSGSSTIQGFGTDISVNKGERINFKINTSSAFTYTIKIYRLGYYQGNGARLIANLGTFTGTVQPSPITNTQTGLVDCGNWSVSAFWDVPSTAVSGVYIARLARTSNTSTASHIVFIVRDDASTSDLFFQTSDATWQAYNVYGGNSLYVGATSYPQGHAAKVSYNRPFITRDGGGGGGAMMDWLFNAEYPMIRFIERNGYDVTYTTNVDAARRGNLIRNHKVFISNGHDEYWSAEQRNNVEAARNNGVNLAFFSGNEVYWKTRWENSVDGSNTPYRTLVCYKEGTLGEYVCGTKCDPTTAWTGLWRDGCSYPSGGGCKPENALTGEISWTESTNGITVSSAYKSLPFWRNTAVASLGNGQSVTLPNGVLGYEWDYEQYTSSYPSNRITLSSTTVSGLTHKLSLYTHSSGALVFGAGTCQWSWGLDNKHDRGSAAPSVIMQQATVNLFGDMGALPATLMSGLVPPNNGPDVTAPTAAITSPVHGASLPINASVNITGTASDVGGTVSKVEISLNGGTTWQTATGTTSWNYSWTPTTAGSVNIRVRGTDNSGNVGVPGANGSSSNITVNVTNVADNNPPSSIITSPANGASLTAGTPVNITGTASDAAGVVSKVEISLDGGSTWLTATGTTSWTYSWTPASAGSVNIKSRATDNSNNVEGPGTPGSSNNITVNVTAAPTTYSIFQPSNTPQIPLENDGQSLELGVKFRTTVNGYILGISYYKGAGASGAHIGNLWSSSGTNLGSANFTNETSSGWQKVLFTTPVAINANTTYVASYFSSSGDYASSNPYFTSAVVNGPVKALANGEDGPNGLYRYTTTSAFPNSNYGTSNYFVDVIFATSLTQTGSVPSVTSHPSSQTVCAGSSVTFTSAADGLPAPTVKWQVSTNNGSTWSDISGATSNSYTFTTVAGDNGKQYRAVWTNSQGSANSNAATLTVNATPSSPTLSVVNNCGNSVLTAGNYTGTLLWSNGATTSSITVTTAGTYTVSQVVNGCTSAAANGVAAPKSTPAAPTVNVANNCGNSVLTASNYTGTLLWSNGATTSSITVTTGGAYTVTQTVNECTSTNGSGTATPKAVAVAPAVNVVNNCGNSVLTASGYTGTLLWSNGATTPSITVTTGGTYTVTQTVNGCTSDPGSGSAAPITPPPAPIVNVVNDCGNSVLTASGYAGTLLWSNGETTPSITVTTGGTYTVTQTINACTGTTGSGLAAPKVIPAAPTVDVADNCGNSVLTAGNYTGNLLWNTGETTASISVTTGGTYTVTQTISGCTSVEGSGTAGPKTIPAAPVVSVVDNCGNSVLTANNYTGTLLWSIGETTSSITVATGGAYTVTQTVNGCTSEAASNVAAPIALPATPVVDVVNNCGYSVLTASNYSGDLLWSTGETTASITVTTGGTYTVTQTIGSCTSDAASGSATPKVIPGAPLVDVTNNCGNSVLTASNYSGDLLWSTGETTASITVITGGTYTVTQTIDGCTSTEGSAIADPVTTVAPAPTVDVADDCGSSVLTAGNYTGDLLWSTGETTASITVTTGGTYTVTQTINGCPGDEGSGVAAPKTILSAPSIDVVNNCGSSILTASNYTGDLLWSTGETTPSIIVITGSTYTVTQTINGCTSDAGSAQAAPKAIPSAPTVIVSDNCGNSLLIAGNYTGTLLWSTGASTPSITVIAAGTYTVTQTVGGCTSTAGSGTATPITSSAPAPIVNVTDNCGSSVLTASGYTGTLTWSTGETTPSITVTTGGTYWVTQTLDGCAGAAGSGIATPKTIPDAPTADVVNDCGNSVLTASNYIGDLLWSTSETTPSITVTTGGTYTVTQTVNGCTGSAANVLSAPKLIPGVPTVSVENNCGSSVLTASNYTGDLLWSTGETTPSITVTAAGTYTVAQTIDGCTSTEGSAIADPITSVAPAPTVDVVNDCGNSVLTASNYTGNLLWITGETTPSITVTAAGTYTVTQTENGCPGLAGSGVAEPKAIPGTPTVDVVNNCGSSVLTASNYSGDLLWSTGETTASITVTTGGTYSVSQTIGGCTSAGASGTAVPKITPAAPTVSVVDNCGNSVLTAANYTGDLLWSTGETTSSITVATGGTYNVTQTIEGCASAGASGIASPLTPPPTPVVSVENNCGSSILTASNYTGDLLWSTGETTASITVTTSGAYTVTQTIDGCTSAAGSANAAPKALPAAPIVNVLNNCGNSVLTASSYTGDLLWSTGETTSSITVTTSGTYTVVQTISGCTGSEGNGVAAPGDVTAFKPAISAGGPLTFCQGQTLTLTSNLTSGNLWSTGATTQSIVVSSSGSYSVENTSAGGNCSITSDPVTVVVNPAPAGSISSLANTVCENVPASVVFNATSGTGPYSIVINGTTYNNVSGGSAISTISSTLPGNSLWDNSTVPSRPLDNDGRSLEVGMKFRVSVDGYVKSIRFYKGSNNDAGTYTLKLYVNSSRALLGSVDFSDRTATGWQTVDLPTPVAVTAGTTYLVSYYSSSGNYANNLNYFTSARTNGPITGLASGTDGTNGVYRYGAGFPTNSYRSSNYWVDIVFATPGDVTLNLTSITDANNCSVSGNLGSITMQVIPCPVSLTRSASQPETNLDAGKAEETISAIPTLGQNHPNPFAQSTLVDFSIPKTGRVQLTLFDLNGRVVQVLMNEVKDAGFYTIPVRRDNLTAGIYYYKLEAGGETIIRKMTIY